MRVPRLCVAVLLTTLCGVRAEAQSRLAILQAEERRASTPRDVALLRSGVRSRNPQIGRMAIRALGRLERPALIGDILPALKAALPEIRAEAATALGQAAEGWKPPAEAPARQTLDGLAGALMTALGSEADSGVRAALSETIGRLPYSDAQQAMRAESALTETLARGRSVIDRLGVAKALGALVRLNQGRYTFGREAVTLLRGLALPDPSAASNAARVRRLALDALIRAKQADADLVARAARDPDAQVRRLAMRAGAGGEGPEDPFIAGLADESAMVRIEALRALRTRNSDRMCAASITAAGDHHVAVVLAALDQLGGCAGSADAVALLGHALTDLSDAGSPRGWHRTAHALVALAMASPERAATALPQFVASRIWQLRMYAARAAALVRDRPTLEALGLDADDNVREAAVEGLTKVAGHEADAIFIAALSRNGYQVVRVGAIGLDGTPQPGAAVTALNLALARLTAKGDDNSRDSRTAIVKTLTGLGAKPVVVKRPPKKTVVSELNEGDLRRLAAPRARMMVRGVGTIELALITSEAPATVMRFARLAQSGYYNGLTFHRVEPNFVVQGGSPGENEYIGDASFMRDEVGHWPHVRGTVGISTRGRDTGDAQFFIDLVDNPRFDHEYTVFGQVLNGIDLIDQILEGDVIEKIEILSD